MRVRLSLKYLFPRHNFKINFQSLDRYRLLARTPDNRIKYFVLAEKFYAVAEPIPAKLKYIASSQRRWTIETLDHETEVEKLQSTSEDLDEARVTLQFLRDRKVFIFKHSCLPIFL